MNYYNVRGMLYRRDINWNKLNYGSNRINIYINGKWRESNMSTYFMKYLNKYIITKEEAFMELL